MHIATVTSSYLMPWGGLISGLTIHAAVQNHKQENFLASELLAYGALSGVVGFAAGYYVNGMDYKYAGYCAVTFCAGLCLVWVWHRIASPMVNELLSSLTRTSHIVRKSRTDVRDLMNLLPAIPFAHSPYDFHNNNPEQFFIGIGEAGDPIYWNGKLPHVLVAGTTGSGKGRKLQCLSVQSILKDEFLIYLDPKNDEFAAHVIYSTCVKYQKKYRYLNLLPESPAQINIFAGAKKWEVEEMLIASLDLADKGKPSDHYLAKNRNAARYVAQIVTEKNLTIAEAYYEIANDAYWQEEAPGFIDKIGELAKVNAINAKSGSFNLPEMVETGGAVYVVGSMTLPDVLKAQQLIFVRIQQLATARDRISHSLKTICVVADEFRYLISRPIIQGLGASRDKGMRVILAFQSFNDLKDCPASLNPETVLGSVVENTPCKLIYKIEDPDTADWLARKSGEIQVDDESKKVMRNIALSEIIAAERTVSQGKDFLFDSNLICNLPVGWSIAYGQGLAKMCYVGTCVVDKSYLAITPEPDELDGQSTPVVHGNHRSKVSNDHFFELEE